jgi:hypothetical protein
MIDTMKCGIAVALAAQKLGGGRKLDYKALGALVAKVQQEKPDYPAEALATETLARWGSK